MFPSSSGIVPDKSLVSSFKLVRSVNCPSSVRVKYSGGRREKREKAERSNGEDSKQHSGSSVRRDYVGGCTQIDKNKSINVAFCDRAWCWWYVPVGIGPVKRFEFRLRVLNWTNDPRRGLIVPDKALSFTDKYTMLLPIHPSTSSSRSVPFSVLPFPLTSRYRS